MLAKAGGVQQKLTARHEVSRYLFKEGDEQDVVVVHSAAVFADGVVVRV